MTISIRSTDLHGAVTDAIVSTREADVAVISAWQRRRYNVCPVVFERRRTRYMPRSVVRQGKLRLLLRYSRRPLLANIALHKLHPHTPPLSLLHWYLADSRLSSVEAPAGSQVPSDIAQRRRRECYSSSKVSLSTSARDDTASESVILQLLLILIVIFLLYIIRAYSQF